MIIRFANSLPSLPLRVGAFFAPEGFFSRVSKLGQSAVKKCHHSVNPASIWQRMKYLAPYASIAACVASVSAAFFLLWARDNGYEIFAFKPQSFNEKNLLNRYGRSIFQFDTSAKEKVLVLTAASDWNGAFNSSKSYYHNFFFKELHENVDIKYRTVWDFLDICEYTRAPQEAIDSLIIAGHGNPEGIELSSFSKFEKGQKLPNWCFGALKKDAIISLSSCSVAQGGANSFAAYLAENTKKTVYAPIRPVHLGQLTMLFNPTRLAYADTGNFTHDEKSFYTRIFKG